MALATQHFDLYIIPNTTPPPVLDISQYDTSRTFVGHVKDIHGKPYNLPNGTTALLEGRNGNKVIFRLNVIVNGDTLTFTPDEILTDAPGRIHATISLDSTGQYLSPLRIIFNIQRAGITKEERTTNPDFKDAVAAAFQAYIDEHGSGGGGGSGEMNVQSDWNQTNINSDAYIKNKPTKLSDFINDENFITEEDLPNTDNFPIYTPQDFGAVGDMQHDDTQAFKDAFAASSRGGTVFVPDGRYKLTDTIRISRWGMMVLSGSVELRFFNMEDGNGGWKPCIKMLLYSRLKGNGSLVIVDHDYKGHAVELYTDEDPLYQPNEPFGSSNPAWRQSREVDNIAIIKRASATNSEVAVTDLHNIGGDGIYIGAPTKIEYPHQSEARLARNFQWTTHVSARIGGGFENGFHLELKDKDESWMSDTYISGVVESAETAVLIDKVTGGVYCDVIFQPLKCYPESAYLPVWKQPTSTSNAYAVGARVHYPLSSSPIYESDISNNMNSPDGEGWHRAQEYIDDPRQLYPVWDSNKTSYQIGDRVHYPTETDPVYENDVADNTSIPTSSGWHRAIQDVPASSFPFIKNGIKIIGSANVDMSRTKIWDWQNDNTLLNTPDKDGNYSHKPYALIGACRGAIISDFGMNDSHLPFHDRIYTNSIGNLFTATIKGAKGILPIPPKYAFYKNYQYKVQRYNYLNMSWRDPQNLMRYQIPIRMLHPGDHPNQLYQIGYFDFADAEVPENGYADILVRQTITIEENDNYGLYGYTNLFFEQNVAEMRWNPVGYGTNGHIPIYYYSIGGENNERRYIYRLVRDNTDIQQIYNCALFITNARRFVFEFENKGAIGSLSSDIYKLIQPKYADNVNLYSAGMVAMQNGRPMICTQSAVFNRDGTPSTAAVVKELALAENSSGGSSAASNFVTPEQFGAVGDGVTDDTLAIQAAFDAASNGGTVKFGLKKTYMVSRRDDDVRRVYASDSNGQPAPTKMKYMLRISGSMTILGQGSTITYKYPIKKSEYDVEQGSPGSTRPMYTDNAKSAVMLFLDNSTKNEGSNAEVNERNYVCIKGLVLDGAWERRIDDIEDPNSPFVRDLSTYGGGKGANWKAICAHGVRGMVLELDSVTVKEFAGEGVYGTYNPGSKVRAFGCTFTNCMPSAFNVAGSFVEAIGCVFNQTEDETKGSEIAGDKNLFDSCTFNIENGFPAIVYGHSNQELIVRNCVFNRTSYKRPVSEVGEQMFINIPNATNVMIDSCVFNDNHQDNHEEALVTTRSASIGKINNCTFNRTEMQANNTMTVLIAQDSISNIVHVTTFPSDGAGIIGRGLLIYLNNLSSYKLTKISPPKSFTIIPVNDCTFTRWGFGNQIVNVNKTVYAHSRVNIPVDYFSLSSAPGYNSTYLYFKDFFVECSGTFNIIIET